MSAYSLLFRYIIIPAKAIILIKLNKLLTAKEKSGSVMTTRIKNSN